MITINLGKNIIKKPRLRSKGKGKASGLHMKDIVRAYYRLDVHDFPTCKSTIETLFKIIADTLANHEEVTFPRFGKFFVKKEPQSNYIKVYFKPSKILLAAMNPNCRRMVYRALRQRDNKDPYFTCAALNRVTKEPKKRPAGNLKKWRTKGIDVYKIIEKLQKENQ